MSSKKTALAKRPAKKKSKSKSKPRRTKSALVRYVAKPSLGQVVSEVRRQRVAIQQLGQATSRAAEFCKEIAGMLEIQFSGNEEDYEELRNVIAIRLAQVEHAIELDHFFGKLNMAFGAAGHVKEGDVIDAVRGYRGLVNELMVDGSQELLNSVRTMKEKALRWEALQKKECGDAEKS